MQVSENRDMRINSTMVHGHQKLSPFSNPISYFCKILTTHVYDRQKTVHHWLSSEVLLLDFDYSIANGRQEFGQLYRRNFFERHLCETLEKSDVWERQNLTLVYLATGISS